MDINSNISIQDSDDGDEDDEAQMAGKNCLTSGCHGAGGEECFYLGGEIYTNSKGKREQERGSNNTGGKPGWREITFKI